MSAIVYANDNWYWTLEILDEVPDQFLKPGTSELDEVAVTKAVIAGRRCISGIKIFQKSIITVQRVNLVGK